MLNNVTNIHQFCDTARKSSPAYQKSGDIHLYL